MYFHSFSVYTYRVILFNYYCRADHLVKQTVKRIGADLGPPQEGDFKRAEKRKGLAADRVGSQLNHILPAVKGSRFLIPGFYLFF